jgi:hypothetical protein
MHFTTTLYLRLEANIKISIFLVAKTSYFKKQIFHLSEEPFFQIFDATIDLRKRPLKTLKTAFHERSSLSFSSPKMRNMYIVDFKNYCTLMYKLYVCM